MNQEKRKMLETFLKSGISPLLLEDISSDIFENAVILESDCDLSLLNGHYEGTEFVAPEWYEQLITQTNNIPILIIKDINKIPIEEQTKFIELLKYKKISTFDLPQNCIIIVTCQNLKENKINEEVYSLMAQI